MKVITKIKNYKILLSFLLSYIAFMMIPIALESITFSKVLNVVKDDAVNSSLIMLEQSRDSVDTRLKEIQGITQVLSMNSDVTKLLIGQNEILTYKNLSRELQNYRMNNSFIKTFIVYIKNSNIVVTPGAATDRDYLFFENSAEAVGKDFNTWYQDFWSTAYPGTYKLMPLESLSDKLEIKQKSLIYMQTLPFDTGFKPLGTIMVIISTEELQKLLDSITINGGWAFIADQNGEIIANSNNTQKEIDFTSYNKQINTNNLNDKEYIVSQTKSKYNGWTFVLGHPTGVVMKKAYGINNMFLIFMVAIVIIGSFLSYILATRNSRPLIRILDAVKNNLNIQGENHGNVFKVIEGSVSELLQNNNELKYEIQQKMPILRSAFLDRLLRGSFISLKELNSAMMNIDLNLSDSKYLVSVLKIDGYSKENNDMLNMAKTITAKAISNIFGDNVLIHEAGEDIIAALFIFNKNSEKNDIIEQINDVAFKTKQLLITNNNIDISVSAGRIYCSLTDVYKSFNEAIESMEYNEDSLSGTVTWYSKPDNEKNYYYYPVEIENKLINLAKIGETSEIINLLNNLYKENFVRRKIPSNAVVALKWEIKGTFNKLMSQIKDDDQTISNYVSNMLEHIDKTVNISEMWDMLKEVFTTISDDINNRKGKNSNTLVRDIIDFLMISYMDSQIDRTMVANKFNISETYLSKIFKEQAGESFSQYLEGIRLQKAKEMIAEKKVSINEISERVGYTSPHAFRRAYKRAIGSLPSKDREET